MLSEVVGNIVSYRPPQARQESTARMGMVLFLGSWAMMFGGLFFAYGMVRARAAIWPPLDLPHLPLAQPTVATILLLGSSLSLQLALITIRRSTERRAAMGLLFASLLGAAFLLCQAVGWSRLYHAGLLPSGGPYPSVFYALTWFHALHVLVGLFALSWLTLRTYQGAYNAPRHLPIRLWAMYWHFVGIVWIVMFLLVYLT